MFESMSLGSRDCVSALSPVQLFPSIPLSPLRQVLLSRQPKSTLGLAPHLQPLALKSLPALFRSFSLLIKVIFRSLVPELQDRLSPVIRFSLPVLMELMQEHC